MALPAMLDEMWVSPLVALVDCVDPIARSAGLALLSRIVQRGRIDFHLFVFGTRVSEYKLFVFVC